MAYHAVQFGVYHRETLQIGSQISTEHTEIGLPATVYQHFVVDTVLLVICFDYSFGLFDVVFQQLNLTILFEHFGSTEAYAGHVDVDASFHPSPAALAHAAPVLERVAHQQVGRYGSDGIIKITNLYCI